MEKQVELTPDQIDFTSRLISLRQRALELGLPITWRAMGAAVKAVGWELAGEKEEAMKGWFVHQEQ